MRTLVLERAPRFEARAVLVGLAFLCVVVALLAPFWLVRVSAAGGADTSRVKPFDSDGIDPLGTEVLLTGLMVVVALLGLLAVFFLDLVRVPTWMRHVASASVVLLGTIAVLHAFLGWPPEVDDNMTFFYDKTTTTNAFGFSITARLQASAGLGWYLAGAGMILLPGIAWSLTKSLPGAAAPPTTSVPTTEAPRTAPVRRAVLAPAAAAAPAGESRRLSVVGRSTRQASPRREGQRPVPRRQTKT